MRSLVLVLAVAFCARQPAFAQSPDRAVEVPQLAKQLRATQWFDREAAAKRLQQHGPWARPALAALQLNIDHQEKRVRSAAIQAIAALGSPGVRVIHKLLSDRKHSADTLHAIAIELGPLAVEELDGLVGWLAAALKEYESLKPDNSSLRQRTALEAEMRGIVDAIGSMGSAASRVGPTLIRLVDNQYGKCSFLLGGSHPRRALVAIGSDGHAKSMEMLNRLANDKPQQRVRDTERAGGFKGMTPEQRTRVEEEIRQRSEQLRSDAAHIIVEWRKDEAFAAEVRKGDPKALLNCTWPDRDLSDNLFDALLKIEDPEVRLRAMHHENRYDGTSDTSGSRIRRAARASRLLHDPERRVRDAAVQRLRLLGPFALDTVPDLESLAADAARPTTGVEEAIKAISG